MNNTAEKTIRPAPEPRITQIYIQISCVNVPPYVAALSEPLGFNGRNYFGNVILAEAFRLALLQRGITTPPIGALGGVLDCVYVITVPVDKTRLALRAIALTLMRVNLEPFASVHYLDLETLEYRAFCHAIGTDPQKPFDVAAFIDRSTKLVRKFKVEYVPAILAVGIWCDCQTRFATTEPKAAAVHDEEMSDENPS